MAKRYAVNLTKKDEEFLLVLKEYGFITVGGGGLEGAGIEGDKKVVVWRVKRLMALGYLAPNNDGLFDGCSQTYRIVEPSESRDDRGVQALSARTAAGKSVHR